MDANVRTLKEKLQCTADHLQLKRISGGKLLNKQQLTTATQPAWRMGSQALIVSRARESRYEQEVRDRNWIEMRFLRPNCFLLRAEDLLFVREGNFSWPSTRNFVWCPVLFAREGFVAIFRSILPPADALIKLIIVGKFQPIRMSASANTLSNGSEE
jgi:hypothetical protein